MNSIRCALFGLLCFGAAAAGASFPTAEEVQRSLQVEPGFDVELVAAEPQIDSPVALAFDEAGRMYVAENRGYPTGPEPGQPPVGRITRLEDRNGDGRFDHHTVFAEGLTFPNGLMPWRGGLIVTCAPDILFLEDTDDDGRADRQTVWLTGFSTSGSTQLRASHPVLGLDGWIYVTSGLLGGDVTCPAHPDRPAVAFGRSDFRFRPDLSAYEPCDGGGQFGQGFDEFGRRFTCYNRVQVQHVVLSSRELRRNPALAFAETLENCPVDTAPEPLPGHGVGARLYPLTEHVTTADSHAGTFTAACGLLVWRGDAWPARFHSTVFTCEPTGNLVHVDRLEPHGATFRATRVDAGREFLASSSTAFRPVFLAQGPDDALYVCDMSRQVIEHPDYLPVEIRRRTDFQTGKGTGRIWKVAAREVASTPHSAARKGHTAADLAQRLAYDHGQRLSEVFRLALCLAPAERTELISLARPALEASDVPAANLVAWLNLLHESQQLSDEDLVRALQHSRSEVREQSLVLARERLAISPLLQSSVIPLAQDGDPQVRFQWALLAGDLPLESAGVAAALAEIATRAPGDRWTRAAVLSSIVGREGDFLAAVLQTSALDDEQFPYELGRILGSLPPQQAASLLAQSLAPSPVDDFPRRAALASGIAETLRMRGDATPGSVTLVALSEIEPLDASTSTQIRAGLPPLFARGRAVALDPAQPPLKRLAALQLLMHDDDNATVALLMGLVDASQPKDIQAAAIRALGRLRAESIAGQLLEPERFESMTPALREETLAALLSAPQHHAGLLTALESGELPANSIDTLRRSQLTEHADPALRARARAVFESLAVDDRQAVYDEWKSCLSLTPQAENGRAIFKKHCATCHRLDREGTPVGPDLFGMRNQPKEAILLHVLIPEREVVPNFTAYVAELKSGRILTGLLVADTANSITMRQALGKEETILRSEIEQLVASKLSLMPQGVEKQMTPQEMADLLAYLKGEGTP